MKKAAWIAWVVALIYFVDACAEEYTGVAGAAAARGGPARAEKASDPQGFESLMAYQWIRCALVAGMGCVFFGLHRWLAGFDIFDPESAFDPDTRRGSRTPPSPPASKD